MDVSVDVDADVDVDVDPDLGLATMFLLMGVFPFFFFSCSRYFYIQSEAALAIILTKRIERMFDILDEGSVRAIERDVQRRMDGGERLSDLATAGDDDKKKSTGNAQATEAEES